MNRKISSFFERASLLMVLIAVTVFLILDVVLYIYIVFRDDYVERYSYWSVGDTNIYVCSGSYIIFSCLFSLGFR